MVDFINKKEHQNIKEHQKIESLTDEQKAAIKIPENLIDDNFQTSYYIGLDWLIENELALMVKPKIEDLDYLSMFMECFNHAKVSSEISKARNSKQPIYKIDIDKKSIPLSPQDFEITPLLIIHFIKVLEKIVKRGLKKDYIRREENLSSKIKGKILFSNHLKKNVMQGRADRVYCNYQDYSVDCLENQVLKKALVFCQNYLNQNLKEKQKDTLQEINKILVFCKSFFAHVSDLRDVRTLKQFRVNKLYRDYDEALKLANLILKRFGYNIQESHQKESRIPPFWIDMALLFEMYVLAKLKDKYKEKIAYQVSTKGNEVDFIKKDKDEKIIIDAKYKNAYIKGGYEKEDIRQLSGYARNVKILEKLEVVDKNTVVDCLIIYPNQEEGVENFQNFKDNLLTETEPIADFTKFYKIGVKLPKLLQ